MAEENSKEEDEHSEETRPQKRKHIIPSITNCHSCGSSQALTDLRTLDSHWRIVLLCDTCLGLVRSAATCSYCFSDVSAAGPNLDCRHCSCRVHLSCVRSQRRLVSPSNLGSDSFACVDCCPISTLRFKNPNFLSISSFTLDGLVSEAKRKVAAVTRAKEKAVEKVRIAKTASDKAKKVSTVVTEPAVSAGSDAAVNDEELALQLHLAMNGSRRISRFSGTAKKGAVTARICGKAELCGPDKSFLDSWVSAVDRKKESSSTSETGVNGVCEDSGNSGLEGKGGGSLLKYCRRRAKKINSSTSLSKNEGEDTFDRYLMKYKRKSGLKAMLKRGEDQLAPCRQRSCSNTSTLSDLSSLPGCQS